MSLTISFGNFDQSITGNLRPMARFVDLEKSLWLEKNRQYTPEPTRVFRKQLQKGLKKLLKHRVECEKLNPANGWGSYDVFLKIICEMISECYALERSGSIMTSIYVHY